MKRYRLYQGKLREHPDGGYVHINEIDRLQAALAPFAMAAKYMTAGKACDPNKLGIWTDNTSGLRVTVADFRRAAEAAEGGE